MEEIIAQQIEGYEADGERAPERLYEYLEYLKQLK